VSASRSITIASAGSGKTYALANQLIAWMIDRHRTEDDPGCDRILASTFTRKAAGEILDRVLEHLAKGVLDAAACRQYAMGMGLDPAPTTEEFAVVLQAVVRSMHRLKVGTLDGFFHRVARSFSSELGLPDHWTMADEFEEKALHMEALTALLQSPKGAMVGDLLQMLQRGKENRSIVDVVQEHVWGRHGAIEQYRLTRLLPDQMSAWSWLRPGEDGDTLDGGRFHSKEVRSEAIKAMDKAVLPRAKEGHERKKFKAAWFRLQKLASEEDWDGFLVDGFVQGGCFGTGRFDSVPVELALLELLRPLVDHARSVVIESRHRQLVSALGLLKLLEQHYRELQEHRGRFTFGDIAQRLAEAGLVRDGELGHLWYRLDGIVRDIALDEFQDTSRSQFDVLNPIIEEILSGIGSEEDRGFLVLADPKQSIYAWRGGTPALVDLLEQRHADQLQASTPLTRSWRSSQIVLDAVDSVFGRLSSNTVFSFDGLQGPAQEGAEAWASRYEPHEAARDLPGYVRVVVPKLDEHSNPSQGHTVDAAVDLVAQRQSEDPGRTIGVLTSSNKAATRIATMLRHRGVEASEEGASALTDSLAVGAILSMVHLADHPGDYRSFYHMTTTPLAGLLGMAPSEGVDRATWRARAREVSRDIRERLALHGYAAFMHEAVDCLLSSCNEADVRRLGHIVEMGELWDEQATGRPAGFVQFVEQSTRGSVASAPVRVMTIHKSKGLEFDEVVLPELGRLLSKAPSGFFSWSHAPTELPSRIVPTFTKPLLPAWPTIQEECYGSWSRQQIQESLSMLYVAMTRARYALHMVLRPHDPKKDGDPKNILTHEGLLRGGLEGLDDSMRDHQEQKDTTVWERGDPDWYRQCPVDQGVASIVVPRRPTLAMDPRQEPRQSVIVAPSMHTPSEQPLDAIVDRDDPQFAMLRGTLMHEFLSLVHWIEDGRPDEAALNLIVRKVSMEIGRPVPEDVLASGMNAYLHALEAPEITQRLSRNSYEDCGSDHLVVRNELPFIARTDSGEMWGRFDRLVLGMRDGRVAWVDLVDFKSDSATVETAPEVLERHREQLEHYMAAIQSIYGLDPGAVSARLLLTGPGLDVSLYAASASS